MSSNVCHGSRFQALLSELTKEHDKELETRDQEITLLRELLNGDNAHVVQIAGFEATEDGQNPHQELVSPKACEDSFRTTPTLRSTMSFVECDHAETLERLSTLKLKDMWTIDNAPPQGHNGGFYDGLGQVLVRANTIQEDRSSMISGLHGFMVSAFRTTECIQTCKSIPHFVATATISPNSHSKLVWDLTGLILIAYDVISIPFNQAFDPPKNPLQITMDWITLNYWTADLIAAFFSGYYDKGELVMDRKRIGKRYLTTWFLIDFAVVGPEWLMIVFTSGNGGGLARVGRIFRSARAIRVLRLLRLLKLQRIINIMYDMIESEYTFILLNLAKLLLIILVLNHVLACCWYLTGRLGMEGDTRNWLEVGDRGQDIAQEVLLYRYVTSLHWSLTQFTPASMGVSATNVWERVFSIIVLFFALVAFSSIVGSITSSMTSLRNMRGDEMKQFWLLRRYLRQKGVGTDLKCRILKFLEYKANTQQKDVQTSNIRVLQWMSDPLQNELQHELMHKSLMFHPFFEYLQEHMEVVVHRLCRAGKPGSPGALGSQPLAAFDVVFHPGDAASKMYFIKSGDLGYEMPNLESLDPAPKINEWASEAVLWMPWWHRGKLYASSTSDMLVLDPNAFAKVMRMHPRPWNYARRYAEQFLEMCLMLPPGKLCDIMREMDEVFYKVVVSTSDKFTGNGDLGGMSQALLASKGLESLRIDVIGNSRSDAANDTTTVRSDPSRSAGVVKRSVSYSTGSKAPASLARERQPLQADLPAELTQI